ncbi:hypothetical protein ACFRH9_21745 [Peribacillus butanolivorans]|uniref:hypothetical protein n=1 Tax=Peribacillus butanolivorans TaxID=421767 RepID=UPI003671DC70
MSGYYSMLAGTLVGNEGSAFLRASSFFYRNFLKSATVNGCAGRIHLPRVMLSDTRGEAEIRTAGEGGAYYTFHGLDEVRDTTTVYKVSKGILTDYLPSLKADLIKIDVDDAAPIVMNKILYYQ